MHLQVVYIPEQYSNMGRSSLCIVFEIIARFVQAEKNINDDTYFRINGYLKDIFGKMMKEHQSQIQTIIKDTLANPLVHCNDLVTKVIVVDAKQESKEMNNTENEHSQPPKVSDHNEQSEQLSSAISDNSTQTLSQVYANEESELKYLLIKDELTKRQNILDEVLLINEALRIKIKEYEVDNLKLPLVKIPTTTIHTSVQTVDSMELVEKRKFELMQAVLNRNRSKRENLENFTNCKMIKSIASDEVMAGSPSVMSSIKSNQSNFEDDSMITLKETISKLKVDEQRRKKRLEKLVLKNFSLKLEICELKKEIKKYSNVWANDRYFNSLFLDATRQMITK